MFLNNGMQFTTFDVDEDKINANCAEIMRGGWWFYNCGSSNLNGNYTVRSKWRGVFWNNYNRGIDSNHMKYTTIMFRC